MREATLPPQYRETKPNFKFIKSGWVVSATCGRHPTPEIWFPERGDIAETRQAKIICTQCPVWRECGNHAMKEKEEHGIWGGLTYLERKKIKRNPAYVAGFCIKCELIKPLATKYTRVCDTCQSNKQRGRPKGSNQQIG